MELILIQQAELAQRSWDQIKHTKFIAAENEWLCTDDVAPSYHEQTHWKVPAPLFFHEKKGEAQHVLLDTTQCSSATLRQLLMPAASSWPRLQNLSWKGLLTSEALTAFVYASGARRHGLDTLDLSLAFPVDPTTLPAVAAAAPEQKDKLRLLHLSTETWTNPSNERATLHQIFKGLAEFSGLTHLYLYGDARVLQEDEDLRQTLGSLSSLQEVRVCGVMQAVLKPLNSLWEVQTQVHTRLQLDPAGKGTSATVLSSDHYRTADSAQVHRYTHRFIRRYEGRGLVPVPTSKSQSK